MPGRLVPLGRRIFQELGFRLIVMLTVALLPLGVVAVVQNYRVVAEAQRSADTALLGLTSESVAGERALIQSALGSAGTLGPVALDRLDDEEQCRAVFEEFVRRSGLFRFAGFVESNGVMRCSSNSEIRDFSQSEAYQELRDDPQSIIVSNPEGDVTGQPSLVIAQPVWNDDRFEGLVLVAMPQYVLNLVREFGQDHVPTGTVVFSGDGRVIGTNPSDLDLAASMPRGRSLSEIAQVGKHVLRGQSESGETATFTVVPLISERLFVLGVWHDADLPTPSTMAQPVTLTFPFIMWIASLGVSYFAVHWMVIRHIRTLGRQMRRFAQGERGNVAAEIETAPSELRELSRTFTKLSQTLAREEAELAASLDEKTVLLKEIHHRVKNNLQLIASIISIQRREIREAESRRVLTNLHDRVMALATIHRNLYQSERLAEVPAEQLLGEIVNQLKSIGTPSVGSVDISTRFDNITLTPDTIVPLSLLATEAVTNALKYVGRLPDGTAHVAVKFRRVGQNEMEFEVTNSCDLKTSGGGQRSDGSNLGMQLIHAFSQQLEGELEHGVIAGQDGNFYRLALRFRANGRPDDDTGKAA